LFSAAAELGGIAAGAATPLRETLAQYGRLAGIAFQFADDRQDGDHPLLAKESEKRRQSNIAAARACARSLPSGVEVLCGFADWIGGNSA
jgi:geranylgeranyl pyrophosphate synthase